MKISFSKGVLLFLSVIYIYVGFNISVWNRKNIFQYDTLIYYEYLPAIFIYNDAKFEFVKDGDFPFVWLVEGPNDSYIPKTTMGVSIMYMPFFLIAHAYAVLTSGDTSGWSLPYQIMIYWSGMIYVLLGAIFLRKFLLRYFSDSVTGITLLLLCFGSNLFYYATSEPTMSHAYSFFLFCTLLQTFSSWLERNRMGTSILLGLVAGLIILVRPSNGLMVLPLVIVFMLQHKENLIAALKERWGGLALASLAGFAVLLLQMVYWKYVTGSWLAYSYGEERFYFDRPHLTEGLFGYRKGWLLYTPIMVFALVGIALLSKELKHWRWATAAYIALHVYVVYSWWCWWYGGSFGSRPLVETYALLALPFAATIRFLFDKGRKKVVMSVAAFVLLACLGLNFIQTLQYRKGLIHFDSMNKRAYWKVFCSFPDRVTMLPYFTPETDYDRAMLGEEE
ncbi:MAG: hypothetical protein KDD36_08200 [Flavobacteriales bacterium]|nr:hypothetical protein [Flavobacteriales bacterium]